MTKRKLTKEWIVVLAVLALAGCGPDTGGAGAVSNGLTGTRWVLTTLNGQPALTGTRVTLVFEDDGTAGGYAGCNHYGGPAMWSADGALAFTETAMTAMACLDPGGVMDQESVYVQLLAQVTSYALAEGQLELRDEAGAALMLFTQDVPAAMDPAALVGTGWELVTMDGKLPLPGSVLTLTFDSATAYHGHAGCRDFSGEYGAEGDTLHFSSMGMSGDDSCLSDEALFKQEHDYIDFISSSTTYVLDNDALNLITPRGEVVVFHAAG